MKKQFLSTAAVCSLLAVSFFSCSKQGVGTKPADITPAPVKTIMATSYTLNKWMGAVAGAVNLANLSIPGSHESCARVEPVSGTAKCQNLALADQLNGGIRFLDIRCRLIGNAFAIHHGSIYQNMNFDDVINACTAFLSSNPTETIVMSVKEEYNEASSTLTFEQTFDTYTAKNPSLWVLGAGIPNLGDVRGKIVLFRRFSATSLPKGIDATNWADDAAFTINNGTVQMSIQDDYKVSDNSHKWSAITSLLAEAKTASKSTLYINFTSGYKSLIFGIPSIPDVSNTINPEVVSYFTSNTSGRFGIIPMDFVSSTDGGLIAATNF